MLLSMKHCYARPTGWWLRTPCPIAHQVPYQGLAPLTHHRCQGPCCLHRCPPPDTKWRHRRTPHCFLLQDGHHSHEGRTITEAKELVTDTVLLRSSTCCKHPKDIPQIPRESTKVWIYSICCLYHISKVTTLFWHSLDSSRFINRNVRSRGFRKKT